MAGKLKVTQTKSTISHIARNRATIRALGLKRIGDRLQAKFGEEVDVKYVYNILDLGYRGEDILWLVESGVLTLGYQSSSYLTERVPDLGIADLPFLFPDVQKAPALAYVGQWWVRRATDDGVSFATPGMIARALTFLLYLYRWCLRPLLPPACRFYPSCSDYAEEALARHGAWRGGCRRTVSPFSAAWTEQAFAHSPFIKSEEPTWPPLPVFSRR